MLCLHTSVSDSTLGIHEKIFISVEFWLSDDRDSAP